jgi:ATP-binding cassette subfamily F protein 3
LHPDWTILDEILSVKNLSLGQARGYLGRFLFSGEDVFKTIGSLSGGEQSRVALAKLTLQGANLLLMDEPTNHLDIPSQEVLQDVLTEFEGTVLLVSHDRYLIRALATEVWAIVDETLHVFKEGYDEYQAWLAARREQRRLTRQMTAKTVSALEREATKAAQREINRRVREIQAMEKQIQRLEARLSELSTALELAGEAQQVDRVRELGLEYDEVEAELQECVARWVEIAETAEATV